MRFIQFYIPLWFAIIYNFKIYLQVIAFLKTYCERDTNHFLIRRLRLYPLILVICWSWATINRLYNFVGKEVFILNFLHIFFGSLQGFLNACVYGLTKSVRLTVKEFIWEKWYGKPIEDPNLEIEERLIGEFRSASTIQQNGPREVEFIQYYT
jgi:hypothetical protein